jgi:hypothetical protein
VISEQDPLGIALGVSATLEELGVLYTIGGSIASSVAGEPRSTLDIDIVVALESEHVEPLLSALQPDFYIDREALIRAIRERRSVNLIHYVTQVKVDLFVAGGTPLDELQLTRRRAVEIAGRRLYVQPPEDILLQKLRWFRPSEERSERQWRDVVAIVRVQGSALDRAYLRAHVPVIGVEDLVERLLEQS